MATSTVVAAGNVDLQVAECGSKAFASPHMIRDYTPFLSSSALRRQPSALRELMALMRFPGMISLGGGMPDPTFFPFTGIDVRLRDGSKLTIESAADMSSALQYSSSSGLPELIEWLKDYQRDEHNLNNLSYAWDVCITNGSTDAISKAISLFVNDGDYVLVENPTFAGTLSKLASVDCTVVGVETDHEGLRPDSLKALLDSWPESRRKPKVLYVIPTGQNPSGSTLSEDRRCAIYQLAQEHNFIILEDDPYRHLTLDNKEGQPDLPSFLSLDTDGRVLRFDSLSKTVSAGMRIGWVTGPAELIDRVQLHQQSTSLHVSGLTQVMVVQLLKHWGREGLKQHIAQVQEGYRKRRDVFCQLAQKHLEGLAEWHIPSAGMFVWFKVLGVHSTETMIKERAIARKVVLVPGSHFIPGAKSSSYVRASYSTATPEQMDEALRRFAALVREESGAYESA